MKSVLISASIALFMCSLSLGADDVKTYIEKAPKTHPRIFFDAKDEAKIKSRIESDPLMKKAMDHIVSISKGILKTKPLERKKIGRRLLRVSRDVLQRVIYLSFAYRITKDKDFLKRASDEMESAAGFSDWNPSHFLAVAEMTAALAIGYDWLYNDLDSKARDKIKKGILEHGLKTSLKGGWWVKTTNNWNQVCHGGLTLGALAVYEDEPGLALKIIERAVANVPRAMHEYEPHGAYPEGGSYWKYGTTYNVVFIAALESVLGTDFGLSKKKGFLECSDYYQHVTGPTGLYYNYSDCGSSGSVSSAMYWFAVRRKKPSLLWRERTSLEGFVKGRRTDRTFPLLMVWAGDVGKITPPTETSWRGDGRTPVAMHRSGWKDRNETFVGIKGGTPSANHAHMDIGSFVMDAGGTRWAIDLGAQSYHSLESKGIRLWGKDQNAQRWKVFRLSTYCHNTLVVDGKQQQVRGFAPIIAHSDKGPMPHTIVDMTTVYKGQLKSVKRGAGLLSDKSVIIQDDIEALDRETTVRWGMLTRADVKISKNGATLTQGGKKLKLKVLSPSEVGIDIVNTEKPRASYDCSNPGTRMIAVTVKLKKSAKQGIVVHLVPGGAGKTSPKLKTLSEW